MHGFSLIADLELSAINGATGRIFAEGGGQVLKYILGSFMVTFLYAVEVNVNFR